MSYRDIETQFAKLTLENKGKINLAISTLKASQSDHPRSVEERKEEIVEAIKKATPEQIAKLKVLFGIKDEASRGLR